jgi:HD-GYP domain-containing protein (c-di-GMP phosphodiesterase class II)
MAAPTDPKSSVANPAAKPVAASPFQTHKEPPPEVRRRPEQRRRSVSLRLVLIASFIILGISPVLFFAVNFIPKAELKIKTDTREQQLMAAPSAVTMLNDGFARQNREMLMLTKQFDIYTNSPDRQARIGDLLGRHVLDRYLNEHLPYLEFITEDGSRFAARPQGAEAGLSQQPALAAVLRELEQAAAQNVPESRIVQTADNTWRLILHPIHIGDKKDDQSGALIGLFDMQELGGVLSSQFQRGGMGYAVVDARGSVILRGGSIGSSLPASLENDSLFTSFVSDGKMPYDNINKQHIQRTGDGKTQNLIATFAPVESSGYGVLIFSDEKFIFKETEEMRTLAIVAGGLIALASIILGWLLGQFILRPITSLLDATRAVAQGDFSSRVKASRFTELDQLGDNFNHMGAEVERLIAELSAAADTNKRLYVGTVRAIANALDAKDPYTRGHSERVSRYARILALEHGLSEKEAEQCEISALLHDIGKVGVEDAILRKPAALTEEEFEIMKHHPGRGAQILGAIAEMKEIIPGVKYHHERWVGGGYPDNLSGERIPVQARVVSVADTIDAMTTERPYQRAMSMAVAASRINQLSGKSFDPAVVESFNRAYQKGIFNIGSEKKLIIPKNKPQVA